MTRGERLARWNLFAALLCGSSTIVLLVDGDQAWRVAMTAFCTGVFFAVAFAYWKEPTK